MVLPKVIANCESMCITNCYVQSGIIFSCSVNVMFYCSLCLAELSTQFALDMSSVIVSICKGRGGEVYPRGGCLQWCGGSGRRPSPGSQPGLWPALPPSTRVPPPPVALAAAARRDASREGGGWREGLREGNGPTSELREEEFFILLGPTTSHNVHIWQTCIRQMK